MPQLLSPRLPLALLCAALLATAGCGGGDEDAGSGAAGQEQPAGDPGEAPGDKREIPESVPDVFYGDAAKTSEKLKAGTPEAGSGEAAMRQVVVDFYAAAARGEGDAACALMTSEGQGALVESVQDAGTQAADCPSAVDVIAEQAADVVVGDADPDEPGAPSGVVPAQVADYEPVYVEVVKRGGDWLIDLF